MAAVLEKHMIQTTKRVRANRVRARERITWKELEESSLSIGDWIHYTCFPEDRKYHPEYYISPEEEQMVSVEAQTYLSGLGKDYGIYVFDACDILKFWIFNSDTKKQAYLCGFKDIDTDNSDKANWVSVTEENELEPLDSVLEGFSRRVIDIF